MSPDDKVRGLHVSQIRCMSEIFSYPRRYPDLGYQGEGRGTIGCSATTAEVDLQRQANVRIHVRMCGWKLTADFYRQDDKTARELNISAGAVLHLVLALRGGTL
jgi:hypothetical protein